MTADGTEAKYMPIAEMKIRRVRKTTPKTAPTQMLTKSVMKMRMKTITETKTAKIQKIWVTSLSSSTTRTRNLRAPNRRVISA